MVESTSSTFIPMIFANLFLASSVLKSLKSISSKRFISLYECYFWNTWLIHGVLAWLQIDSTPTNYTQNKVSSEKTRQEPWIGVVRFASSFIVCPNRLRMVSFKELSVKWCRLCIKSSEKSFERWAILRVQIKHT